MSASRAARAFVLSAFALSALHGCGRGAAVPPRGASRAPDVLLVTIDTLRADRLGCYGYGPAHTPVLDGLARRGVRFAVAVGHAPLTAPSHASILTGLTPLGHGVRDNGAYVLPETARSVAEDFQKAGYRTAAFVSGFPLKRRFGFARGFDVYDDHLPRGNDLRRTAYVERTADRTTDAALRWLDTAGSPAASRSPFFLWVHYFDPHAPYEAPAEAMVGRPRRTTARSRSWTPSSDGCSVASRRASREPRCSCSSLRTTGKAWASTARTPTASSSTMRRSACRSSWPARA